MSPDEENNVHEDNRDDRRKPGLLTPLGLTGFASVATVVLLLLTIGGLLAGIFDPFDEVDLTVQFKRDTLTGLPEQESPFTAVIEVEISNSGSTPIGEDHRPWRLTLLSNNPGKVTKVGLLGFRKKPEYSAAEIFCEGLVFINVGITDMLEKGSHMWLNHKEFNGTLENVKDNLYGAQYGKSSK